MRNAILWLLRLFAYLYHLALSLFLLAVGVFAMLNGGNNLRLGMLPWEGAVLVRAVAALGAVGIVCTLLAMKGSLCWLFPLWALVALGLMVRGFFVSSYSFPDEAQFRFGLWLTSGALVAFLGSLSVLGKRSKRR